MNRRKTKKERELVADISKSTMIFCNKQGKCKSCPLVEIKDKYNVECPVAYVIYLLNKEVAFDESDM